MARNQKYDWDTWFGQSKTTIRRGMDYHISQSMMYQTIKNNANRRGIKVDVQDHNSYIVIKVLDEQTSVPPTSKTTISSEPKATLV